MMKIAMTGSHGLIGKALTSQLLLRGHEIISLSRQITLPPFWDYKNKTIDKEALEGCDAVIHLAGENIAKQRWSAQVKEAIRDSRVSGTQFLAQTLNTLKNPPKTFLCASAIGYYGHRDDEVLTEASVQGKGFLAECCAEWEKAAQTASSDRTRVINLRFGMVLSASGGAMSRLLPPFKMGMGGTLGDGKQYMSWIDIEDVTGAILHLLNNSTLQGPVNLTAPSPETNRDFTLTLSKILAKPALVPLPAFAAKMLFGDMAEELLLASTRVLPDKLLASGYSFAFPTLESSLHHILN